MSTAEQKMKRVVLISVVCAIAGFAITGWVIAELMWRYFI